ncbi:hypothetical protein ABZ490_13720 [Streptomyces sp. NPDC005811]|uniref:hypothetical protein n=1 Tax=Streptomyces sp. NPDC005811 TaxID=3154565 RepID=UPI0033F74E05
MPALVNDSPLGITCTFSDGTTVVKHMEPGANPQLARQLLDGLADLVHPQAGWTRRGPSRRA